MNNEEVLRRIRGSILARRIRGKIRLTFWQRIKSWFRRPYSKKELEKASKSWRSNINYQTVSEVYERILKQNDTRDGRPD